MIDTSLYEEFYCTAQTAAFNLSTNLSGQKSVLIGVYTAASQTITLGSSIDAIGVSVPASTTAGKWHYFGLVYNATATKYHCVAFGVQA